ncbi:gamma-glutamyltransferase [Candidatus Contubernalis alkaliaceticus]|uniref:gamma-glutamyltransferase n=1 Tax=Candidatus Contubernalis alkaliaceticus TaxID=338645 RepID=UPI001F4C055D|nr:gamma-glutamyltransferase [Candidatus Contubernalis alkalaceticus]UNC91710.1 gamma-glutamyltransferase [Candidatus Contubernalis alkalaceticus]
MKKLLTAIKLLITFSLGALVAVAFWFYILLPGAGAGAVELKNEPMAELMVIGEIAGNNVSLSRWLRSKDYTAFKRTLEGLNSPPVLSHYNNSLPTAKEKQTLEEIGLSFVTLPFLPLEDLEYVLEEDITEKYDELQRDLAALSLMDSEKDSAIILLPLPLEINPEEVKALVSPYKDVTDKGLLIVKFTDASDNVDTEDSFISKAKLAIENGAHLVIGNHRKSLVPLQIYQDALIVESLDYFLGDKNEESASILFRSYEEGIQVEVHPLLVERGLPKPLTRPWQYLKGKDILEKAAGEEFSYVGLKAIYTSPSLLPQEEEEKNEEAADLKPAGDTEISEIGSFGVAAGHPLAVEAGMKILRAGGSAVDAAIAASYALAVVEPHCSGLGGGGIMLIHLAAEDRQVVIDYRETAPYTLDRGEISKIMNWPSTGIPGFVRGLEKAITDYGTMAYSDVIEPAYLLAKEGFPMYPELNSMVRNNSGKLARSSDALQNFFRRGWAAPIGEIITQPTLAVTLKSIMEGGSEVFYEGYIGESIMETLAQQGMNMSTQDLTNYHPMVREALTGTYRDYNIITVPPPAGGFNLLQQLKILESYDLSTYTEAEGEVYYLLEQVMKATYSDRRNYVGDPNFVNVPIDELLSENYIQEKINEIDSGTVSQELYMDPHRPSDNTTHIVAVDAEGNWVSVTNTISYFFGYGLQAEGFFLNTQLNNFSSNASSPNYFQPGKRPFSHISPTLVFKRGEPIMALGTPGGRRIPAYLAQILVQHIDFGADIIEAVDSPRFWSEGKEIRFEKGMPQETLDYFRKQGYRVIVQNPSYYFGRTAALYLDKKEEKLSGTGDPLRSEGTAEVENN